MVIMYTNVLKFAHTVMSLSNVFFLQ